MYLCSKFRSIISAVTFASLVFLDHSVTAKCLSNSDYGGTMGILSDWAACFFGVGGSHDQCPHGFFKLAGGELCGTLYGKKRVCCLVEPTSNVKVQYTGLALKKLIPW